MTSQVPGAQFVLFGRWDACYPALLLHLRELCVCAALRPVSKHRSCFPLAHCLRLVLSGALHSQLLHPDCIRDADADPGLARLDLDPKLRSPGLVRSVLLSLLAPNFAVAPVGESLRL